MLYGDDNTEKSAMLNLRVNPIIKQTLPNVSENIDATKMNEDQIHSKIQKGYESYKSGRIQNAARAFSKFREDFCYEYER